MAQDKEMEQGHVRHSHSVPPSPSEPQGGIVNFFGGKSVLVTGGTGFLGKAIIEKLLRSCPHLQNIFVLIRPKFGSDGRDRVKKILSCPLFKSHDLTTSLGKVVPVTGDLSLPALGLSPKDLNMLVDHVCVVIHSAATVRFDEPLKNAVAINLEGTKKVLELAARMKKLKALIHVSTAYSNCDQREIDEVTYPHKLIEGNDLIQVLKWMPKELVDFLEPKLLDKKPNTYTFTKHLAENLVMDMAAVSKIPVAIVRPSIVLATHEEPMAGWIENLNGPSGIVVAYAKGILRSMLCNDQNKMDIIPLDHVVNLIISAAWYTATVPAMVTATQTGQKMTIFNCCSGTDNPFHFRQAIAWAHDAMLKTPLTAILWYPSQHVTSSPILNSINNFLFHLLPAMVIDWMTTKKKTIGKGMGMGQKKGRMMALYDQVKGGVTTVQYFCTREWTFCTKNTKRLQTLLKPEERLLFNFDVGRVNWKLYTVNYVCGLRKFVLGEKEEAVPGARVRLKRLYILHRGLQLSAIFLLTLFLLVLSSVIL